MRILLLSVLFFVVGVALATGQDGLVPEAPTTTTRYFVVYGIVTPDGDRLPDNRVRHYYDREAAQAFVRQLTEHPDKNHSVQLMEANDRQQCSEGTPENKSPKGG